ncbi:Crp/Fnr family transcriptional regulator [Magnetospira thiophila]
MRGEVFERKVVFDNDFVFKEGDRGDRAYIVQEGKICIFKALGDKNVNEDGEEEDVDSLIGEIGPGGVFGEMALVDDAPRMASARSEGTTTLVVIPRRTFVEKLSKADPFIKTLMTIFVRTIRTLSRDRRNHTK